MGTRRPQQGRITAMGGGERQGSDTATPKGDRAAKQQRSRGLGGETVTLKGKGRQYRDAWGGGDKATT